MKRCSNMVKLPAVLALTLPVCLWCWRISHSWSRRRNMTAACALWNDDCQVITMAITNNNRWLIFLEVIIWQVDNWQWTKLFKDVWTKHLSDLQFDTYCTTDLSCESRLVKFQGQPSRWPLEQKKHKKKIFDVTVESFGYVQSMT